MAQICCQQCGKSWESQYLEPTDIHVCNKCWMENHDVCPFCDGAGGWSDDEGDEVCSECGGSGKVSA